MLMIHPALGGPLVIFASDNHSHNFYDAAAVVHSKK